MRLATVVAARTTAMTISEVAVAISGTAVVLEMALVQDELDADEARG